MFSKINPFWLLFLTWMAPANLFAQTKSSSESITVDLGSGTFVGTKGLPFDVPFKIEGEVTENLRQISLKYRVKNHEVRKWMQFPNDSGGKNYTDTMKYSSTREWNQFDNFQADQKFYLQVGPLHPNVTYEFQFRLIRSIDISDEQSASLKEKLLAVINKYAENVQKNDVAAQTLTNKKLNLILKQSVTPGAEIMELDHKPYKLDITDSVIGPIMSNIIIQNTTIATAKTDLSKLQDEFASDKLTEIKKILQEIDITKLSPASASIWNSAVGKAPNEYGGLKMSDLAILLLDPSTDLTKIVKGFSKIDGNSIIAADKFHEPSVQLLEAFYRNLNEFTRADNSGVFVNKPTPGDLRVACTGIVRLQNKLEKAKKDRAEQTANFPDILEDKLISQSFVFFDQSNMDVVSEANPYIGLDFGTAFIPSYNQLFFYEGVNFYFAPVNKDAALSRFSGNWRNLLSKMISIHIGLTQNLVKVENKRYVPLIKDVGSLLVGAGIRVNRITRINVGTMFFFQKDINPLIDNNRLTSRFTTSLTFDLNIAKALGNIGRNLNLNQ